MSERVLIVGPGRMGLAMGAALAESGGIADLTFFGRDIEPPPHPLFDESDCGAEYRIGPQPVPEGTTVVLLAVPDDSIHEVAHSLAMAGPAPAGCVALHLSGAVPSDVLAPLHAVGYEIGTMHPLQTVADPWSGGDRLRGASFAISGEPGAIAASRRLVALLGGRCLLVPPAFRPIYHAAAVFASNYLVSLVGAAVRLLGQAGIDQDDALAAILPLLRGTLDNLDKLGASAALTGPIARGDVDTVRLHLARLSPEDRLLYCALGREAVRIARANGLDEARASEIESLLAF